MKLLLVVPALALSACGPTPGPADPRSAQVERLPADSWGFLQGDVQAVLPSADIERWFDWLHRSNDAIPDTSCIAPMVATVGTGLVTGFPIAESDEPGVVVIGSSDLDAEKVAECLAGVIEPLGGTDEQPHASDGVYYVGQGSGTLAITRIPGGAGIAVGMPDAVAALLGEAPVPGVAASGTLARLRGLLPPRDGDFELWLLRQIPGLPPYEGAGMVIRRGEVDHYEIVVVAPSEVEAQMYGLGLYAGLAMITSELATSLRMRISAGPGDDPEVLVAEEILPRAVALGEAVTPESIGIDGNVLRVEFTLDPAIVAPLDIVGLAGMAWLTATLGPGCTVDPAGIPGGGFLPLE